MSKLPSIREKTRLIPDDELKDVCLQIIDEVADRLERGSQGLWTVSVIAKWLGRSPADVVLKRGLQVLVSREDAQLLEMHFLFFASPDSNGEKIEDQEVEAAFTDGFLVDPVTGGEIRDFKDFLVPYFEPAHDLEAQ